MAKGEIFGELGADDISEPVAIQTVVEFFKANPDAVFVFGGCNYINEKGEIINRSKTKDFNLEEIIKVGYYDDMGNDLDFLIRVGMAFPVHRIENVLSNFRIHPASATSGLIVKTRKMWLRDDCMVSRRYGGGIFSGYCRRYYRFTIVEWLRPVLGFAYPAIKKIFRI